jgi:hypothetical protein
VLGIDDRLRGRWADTEGLLNAVDEQHEVFGATRKAGWQG